MRDVNGTCEGGLRGGSGIKEWMEGRLEEGCGSAGEAGVVEGVFGDDAFGGYVDVFCVWIPA